MESTLINVHQPITVCKASAGTGKTYTLAAYYIGLLLSGEDYRSILAITFTNKATSEMSERIMGYLYAIGQGGETDFLAYARRFMSA
jgi:ATP-dependent exoDNAse (exonuclease V) beta subunit